MKVDYEKIIEKYKNETAKECYEIIVCEEQEPSIMDNKLGGIPYFPDGEKYPTTKEGNPMALLLQVNLKDIDLEDFPKEGILEIFVDANFGWPIEYELFIFPEGCKQTNYIPNVNLENFIFEKSLKIDFKKTIAHMPVSDYRATDTIKQIAYNETGIEDIIEDIFDDNIYNKLNLSVPKACLGGYADFTQEDPRYDEDEGRDACLFKLDSYLHDSIMIGDSGILTVTISEEDLKDGEIKNAVVDWDCC